MATLFLVGHANSIKDSISIFKTVIGLPKTSLEKIAYDDEVQFFCLLF
jgi:hypothetical protein